jgi:hypothetical protein
VSAAPENPFTVLGIAATLDALAVKRAWFAALTRHPPHADPEGFRRIRAAYEALMAPGGLAAAVLSAPLVLETELARYRERYDEALARAGAAASEAAASAQAGAQLMEELSRKSLEEALALFRCGRCRARAFNLVTTKRIQRLERRQLITWNQCPDGGDTYAGVVEER